MKTYKQMCDSHKEIELELYEAIQEVGDAVGINTDKVPADIEKNHSTIIVQHKNKTNATNYPIEIFNSSENKSIAKGTTNNNGEFNFEVPPNIEHLICKISMDDKTINTYELGSSNETKFNITIPDENRGTLTIKLDYGQGTHNSTIQLGEYKATSDKNNTCTINNIKYGTYDLVITTKYYQEYKDKIVINSPNQEYKAFLKPLLSDLTVHVKDSVTKEPIENATVTKDNYSEKTDKEGNAILKLLKQDTFLIKVNHDKYESNQETVDINSETEEITLYLDHKPTNVTFKVTTQDSNDPILYAFIKLDNAIGESNMEGRHTFKNIKYGTHHLNVSAIHHSEHIEDISITSENPEINIKLKNNRSNEQ